MSNDPSTVDWLGDPREVFTEKELPANQAHTSITASFKNLTKTYKDFVRSWWEVQTVETYLRDKIVPRGLRNPILPSARIRSQEFTRKWEQESIESYLRLMKLLYEEENGCC